MTKQQPQNLERALDSLPVQTVSGGFTERVMAAVRTERLARRAQPANRFGLPPDVQNMFIAIAATYLFIVSGVLTRIVTLDERMMATRVNEAVEGLLQVVDALRQTL